MTEDVRSKNPVVDALLAAGATMALTWVLGFLVFPGLRSPIAIGAAGLVGGLARWFWDDSLSTGDLHF
jgi:hypothetical protein